VKAAASCSLVLAAVARTLIEFAPTNVGIESIVEPAVR
jgi:hypothetical protein